MKKLEVGMVCVITGYKNSPENLGKGCTLVKIIQPDEYFTAPDGILIQSVSKSVTWLCEGDNLLSHRHNYRGWCLVRPEHLTPITPDNKIQAEQDKLEGDLFDAGLADCGMDFIEKLVDSRV